MRRRVGDRGFSLIEMIIVMVIMGLIAAAVAPMLSRSTRNSRVNRAGMVIAGDLEQAFSLASRQRRPVRISWNGAAKQYTLADRASGSVKLTRSLGVSNSEFKLTTVTFSTSPVDVFPGGFASGALTVTIGEGGYTRRIQMTRAGVTLVGR